MDLFSTNTLMGVVEGLKTPTLFLLNRYFPKLSQDDSEEIHFDVISSKRRIAPFVSPLVAGKIVESLGFTTNTFKPAYIKDKRVFDSNRPFKRAVGEQIGGSMTPMQRQQALLASELQDQLQMIDRRLEVMAAESIRTGHVIVVGDQYPSSDVNFGRSSNLDDGEDIFWGTADSPDGDPLEDLAEKSALVTKESGAVPLDVIMGIDAWSAFRANEVVKSRLDIRNVVGASLNVGAQLGEGGTFRGTIDGFNIFTYAGWYVDPQDGVEKEIWPGNEVVMLSQDLEGVRAFGAIRDEEAGFQAVPYYPKSWLEKDPAVRYLMTQSAPLTVPTRIDASIKFTVDNGSSE